MGIIGTYVVHLMIAHPLKANPDIRLNIFHQMAYMDLTIGIR